MKNIVSWAKLSLNTSQSMTFYENTLQDATGLKWFAFLVTGVKDLF